MRSLVQKYGWPALLQVGVIAAAIALWLKLLTALGFKTAFAHLGVAGAWACSTTALLFIFGTLLCLLRKRDNPLLGSQWLPNLFVALGTSHLITALAFFISNGTLGNQVFLGGIGGLLILFGRWRRGQPYTSLPILLLHLVVVMAVFQIPREQGLISIRWSNNATQNNWTWNGGNNCTSSGKAKASITAYRPGYLISAGGLSGNLGHALARLLNRKSITPDGRLQLHVSGRLSTDSPGCYLPFYHSATLQSTLSVTTHFYREGGGDKRWTVSCGGNETLSFNSNAQLLGVGSCRDLTQQLAAELLGQLHAKARAIAGYR
jgi:hypothetical protein